MRKSSYYSKEENRILKVSCPHINNVTVALSQGKRAKEKENTPTYQSWNILVPEA